MQVQRGAERCREMQRGAERCSGAVVQWCILGAGAGAEVQWCSSAAVVGSMCIAFRDLVFLIQLASSCLTL